MFASSKHLFVMLAPHNKALVCASVERCSRLRAGSLAVLAVKISKSQVSLPIHLTSEVSYIGVMSVHPQIWTPNDGLLYVITKLFFVFIALKVTQSVLLKNEE